jgi:hypothetical protein
LANNPSSAEPIRAAGACMQRLYEYK